MEINEIVLECSLILLILGILARKIQDVLREKIRLRLMLSGVRQQNLEGRLKTLFFELFIASAEDLGNNLFIFASCVIKKLNYFRVIISAEAYGVTPVVS